MAFLSLDPLLGLRRACDWAINAVFPENVTVGVAQLAFAALGLLGFILGFKHHLRPSYNTYTFFTWAISVSTSWWISIPRYMLILFPLFITLSILGCRRKLNLMIAPIFLTLLSFFTFLFSKGAWAF